MTVEINIEKLLDYGVTINQYLFLQFVYQQQHQMFEAYLTVFDDAVIDDGKKKIIHFYNKDDLDYLISLGYLNLKKAELGYRFSNMEVTSKYIDHFIEKPFVSKIAKEKVEDWIDEWYELWPKGVKSGGYLVRSDKNGCLNKMKSFIKTYKFDKEIIIRATKDYINHLRMSNFAYIQIAHYFISKNNSSNLAAACEDVLNKLETKEIENLEVDYTKDKFVRTLNDGD
jgi:hypothetical protein